MAAAGVVCLQEFGQYDDWRIVKNMDIISAAVKELPKAKNKDGTMPFDGYTLYYVGQALSGEWRILETVLPDHAQYLVQSQVVSKESKDNGKWIDRGGRGGGRVGGKPGDLYGTSVGCFILAIPNRYLPILQEGKIESLKNRTAGPSPSR